MRRILVGVVVWAVVLAWPGARAAQGQPLAERLPASTIVYIGWTPSAAMQNTMMARMLADERITAPLRQLFQDFILGAKDAGGEGERISDHLPALLETVSQCEGCLAVLELDQGKKKLRSQSVFMVDLGAKKQLFEKHFAPIQANLKERLGERLQLIKLDKTWVYYKADREGKPQFTWGIVGDTFIMYFGEGSHQFVPKLVKGQLAPNLKTSPAFVDCLEKIPGESVFTTYIDTGVVLGLVRRMLEREGGSDAQIFVRNWEKLMGELGADVVKGMAEKTTIEDRQFVTRSLVRTSAPAKGLLGLFAQPAVDDAMLKAIPADAMAAFAGRLDLAKFYDQIKNSAITVAGEPAKEAFKEIEQGAAGVNVPIQQALASLGDQWVIYNAGSTGGFAVTGWTIVCDIRDKENFGRVLNVLRGLAAGENAKIREIRGDNNVRVEYVQSRDFNFPFPIAWTTVNDRLIVALYPQLVEDAAQQILGGGKSILDNPEYVAARRRTGNSGAMFYMSGPEVIRSLYPAALILVGLVDQFSHYSEDERRIEAVPMLPSMQRVMRYVGTDALSIKPTPDGILKTRSAGNPLLSPMTWLDSPAVWLALGIPALGASSEQADRIKSAANLRQIGMGVMLYANENNGAYPPDLQTLTKKQDLSADCLVSPFGPAKEGGDVVYLHFAGMSNKNAGAEIMVAYDKAALEQGEGTNVLYGDGRVEWLDSAGFKKGLEESKKKAALNAAQP